ncbi:hypothetical protein DOTSEDRAFT_60823 [Dothistroma septosporum NZE10]|uniref:FAD/NAD(P)-binding domain-containing protein n=1 Tax=Dothistroma septosporum (strain NZE10 / CBS 128990) TaxID=675120 RepID=N1PUR4_DOTSN|nr:hypothetical protein DOTSEDRAFT_60823 [Dothistroma septosporum NZE10]
MEMAAAAAAVESKRVNVPAPDLNGAQIADFVECTKRYEQERDKRLGKGLDQLLEDPWIEAGTPVPDVLPEGGHSMFLITGAGFGGIIFAILFFVDPAGGFGGTWYWNRYPGLMCDVEAYIYMPMLEEMDYMPKHKYASGEELRLYTNKIVASCCLHDSAMFQSKTKSMTWDSVKEARRVDIDQTPKRGQTSHITVTAGFVILAHGLLNNAKLPSTLGGDSFRGEMFHTARWDYEVTGGSPAQPELTELKDKKVGIIGTGAAEVQIVPQLAKWAKHLTVFQRTPSAVNTEIATQPGWHQERILNFCKFVCNDDPQPGVDMISDGGSGMASYTALIGSPAYDVNMQNVGDHIARLHALDFPHSEKVRQGAMHVVTQNGVQFRGIDYDVDVLIRATGFFAPSAGTIASRAGINAIGPGGQTLDGKTAAEGVTTLHGVVSNGFPNFFMAGPSQVGESPDQMFNLRVLFQHVAYIIAAASRKEGEGSGPSVEEQMKAAKGSIWPKGIADVVDVVEAWEADGQLAALDVRSAAGYEFPIDSVRAN